MSEGNEPKKKCSAESTAECSSTMRTTKTAADLDHTRLSPMIRHLVENMSDEHWRIVHKALCVPRTKVEVGHLCAGIVVKVVRTARRYLLPALLEVVGVPTAHVLTCGPKRVNTSEAMNAAKPFLGHGMSDVPIFVEEHRPADFAEASGLSSSIPLLNYLTNSEFQHRATKQVSQILLKNLKNESYPESPTGISPEDDELSNTDVDLSHSHDFYPSDLLSESVAENLVGEVFDFMNERVSDQDAHSAAFSIVSHVIKEVKGAVESALAIGAVSLNRVCAASERLFSATKRALGKSSVSSSNRKDAMIAEAKKLIGQVIVSMQHELPDPKNTEDLEQGLLVHRILAALLKEVQMAGRPQSPRLPSSHSSRSGDSQRDGDNNELYDAPARPELTAEGIPLPLACPSDALSPVSANETISRMVDTIFEWEKCVPSTRRHEQVIPDAKIEQCSHGIACEIQKILKSHPGLQTVHVPVGKSVSDSVLLRLRPRAGEKNELPSGLVYDYIEEAVKRLVLSSLFPSASNQQSAQGQLEASEALSGELQSSVDEFTQVITQEVMMTLSTQLAENMASHDNVENTEELFRKNQKLSDKQRQGFLSHLDLLESKNAYASLVCMLVIKLLKKISNIHQNIDERGLPDNVLDMSKDLTERILHELKTSFDVASDERYPEDLKCHLIFRGVYKGLVQHFGSENALSFALESESPSLASSLADKLTKEIVKTCNLTSTSASTCPVQPAVEARENKVKTRKKMFFFRLKMPTINWKKSGASKARATETSPQLSVDPVTARPLEAPQEDATTGCCCFRIPKLKFSFKKIMKRVKVGPCDYSSSFEESSDVFGCAASSSETQLDQARAELPLSQGLAEQEETGPGLADMSSQENLAL